MAQRKLASMAKHDITERNVTVRSFAEEALRRAPVYSLEQAMENHRKYKSASSFKRLQHAAEKAASFEPRDFVVRLMDEGVLDEQVATWQKVAGGRWRLETASGTECFFDARFRLDLFDGRRKIEPCVISTGWEQRSMRI